MNSVNISGVITYAQYFANEPGKERLVLSVCNEYQGKDQVYKTYFNIHLFGRMATDHAEVLVKGVSAIFVGFQVGSAKKGEEWQTVLKNKPESEIIFPRSSTPQAVREVEAHTYDAPTGRPKPSAAPVRAPIMDDDDDMPF